MQIDRFYFFVSSSTFFCFLELQHYSICTQATWRERKILSFLSFIHAERVSELLTLCSPPGRRNWKKIEKKKKTLEIKLQHINLKKTFSSYSRLDPVRQKGQTLKKSEFKKCNLKISFHRASQSVWLALRRLSASWCCLFLPFVVQFRTLSSATQERLNSAGKLNLALDQLSFFSFRFRLL